MSVSRAGALIVAVGLGVAVMAAAGAASAEPTSSGAESTGGAQSSSASSADSSATPEPTSPTTGTSTPKAPVKPKALVKSKAPAGRKAPAKAVATEDDSAPTPYPGSVAVPKAAQTTVASDDASAAKRSSPSEPGSRTPRPSATPTAGRTEPSSPNALRQTQPQAVEGPPAAPAPLRAASSAVPATMRPEEPPALAAVPAPADPASAVVGVVTQVVTGLLSFLGLGPAVTPAQAPEPPTLVGLFEYARRQFQRTLLNQSPTAQPVQFGGTAGGVVDGTIGAVDYDQDQLVYRVAENPLNGSAVVRADGTYTYTPTAAFAATGGTDTFTVLVDDNTGFHLHLFGGSGQISVPVVVTVANPTAQTATVAVGDTPTGVALNGDGTRAYVTNLESNTVSVIDTLANQVAATIAVGSAPSAVAVGPDGSRAYVANFGADSVSVIDTVAKKVIVTVAVGDAPAAIALNPNGSRAYVVNGSSDTVSVIDTATNFVTATIPVGRNPNGIAVSPDGRTVFVTNFVDESVSVIDAGTNTVVASPTFGGGPSAIAVSPDGRRAYVTNLFTNTVSVIDTATGASAVIGVGGNPTAVAVSSSGARVFVTNSADDTVSVIDTATRTVVDTIDVGNTPDAVAVNPIGALVYVANSNSNSVSVLPVVADASRPPTTVPLPPLGSTRGFDVYNLTSQTLTLVDYRTDKRPDKNFPPIGSTVAPGQAIHFEVVYRFLITDQIVQPVFSGPDGARYNVGLQVGPFNGPGTGCTVSGGNGQQCTPRPNGPDLIPGNTVKLLDKPGTVVEFGPGQAQDQAKVLNNLCYQDSQASCSFKADRQVDTFGLDKALVSDLENQSFTEVAVRSLTLSDTRTESDSVKVTVKASRSFLEKIVNLEISAEYGHTWTFTHTFTEQITIRQPPRTIGGVNSVQPVYRVFGDFTLNIGNTTFILRDVFFDTPNPNLPGRYQITERPLDDPTGDVLVFDVQPDSPPAVSA